MALALRSRVLAESRCNTPHDLIGNAIMSNLGKLTSSELGFTISSLVWMLERMAPHGLLEPSARVNLRSLLVECREEQSSRAEAERRARQAAVSERMARSSRGR